VSKILVFGKNGQIGSQLCKLLKDDCICVGSDNVNLLNLNGLENYLNSLLEIPSVIIDAAAYTQVDKAEGDGKENNYKLNTQAPTIMAKYCKKHDIPFVYYTTDYVFDGAEEKPFTEDNKNNLNPLNEYGKSKLEAEREIQKIGGKYLIFRTSWVYNEVGKNFIHTMLRLGKEKEELNIVSDQFGSPSYALDIANYTVLAFNKALKMKEFPTGIYHLVNKGYTSWYKFALKIFEFAKQNNVELKVKKVNAIKTNDFPTPAKRPLNSRLNTEKFEKVFGIKIRSWEDAFTECISKILE
jgi:dTDP-4-dehydrorhamnose reductase